MGSRSHVPASGELARRKQIAVPPPRARENVSLILIFLQTLGVPGMDYKYSSAFRIYGSDSRVGASTQTGVVPAGMKVVTSVVRSWGRLCDTACLFIICPTAFKLARLGRGDSGQYCKHTFPIRTYGSEARAGATCMDHDWERGRLIKPVSCCTRMRHPISLSKALYRSVTEDKSKSTNLSSNQGK